MDGPAMAGGAGGGAIASAYVEIGGDLTGLRAAEQEAKEIFARISAMGGGSVGGGANPNVGAGMATPVGGGVSMQIKIDEANIRQQIDSAIRSYAPQPIKIPIEFVQPTGTPFAGTSGQIAGVGATVGPASQGALQAVQNLTGRPEIPPAAAAAQAYGIAGEVNGVADLTRSAVFAGQQDPNEAGRRARGTAYTPPDYTVARGPGRVGQTFAMAGGRFMQGLEEAAEGEAIESEAEQFARYQRFRSRPNQLRESEEEEDQAAPARQRQGLSGGIGGRLFRRLAMGAIVAEASEFVGQRLQNQHEIDLARAEQSAPAELARLALSQTERVRSGGPLGINQLLVPAFEAVSNAIGQYFPNIPASQYSQLTAVRTAEEANVRDVNAFRGRDFVRAAELSQLGVARSIQQAQEIDPIERQRDAIRAQNEQQRISVQHGFDDEISRYDDSNDPGGFIRKGLTAHRDQDLQSLRTLQAAQIRQLDFTSGVAAASTAIIARGGAAAARARMGGDEIGAIEAERDAQDYALMRRSEGLVGPQRNAAVQEHERIIAQSEEAMQQYRLGARRAGETVGIGMLSAQQQMRGDIHGARLTEIVGGAEVEARATRDPLQVALIRANAQSQAQLYEYNYQRDFAAQGFSLDARSAIAGDIIADHPTAGRATGAVARARLEYDRLTRETNDPKRLAQARATLSRELEAERHELIDQHGGELAITMSASAAFAHRPGLDLTEHTADVQAAAGVLGKGIRDVRNGRAIAPNPITGGTGGTSPEQVLTDAKAAIVQFMAAVTKLAAAKGVALFQN